MDEQVRSDHDVPADGDSAARHAPPDLPDDERHHHASMATSRLRRRQQGISRHPNRRPQARPQKANRGHLHGYTVGQWEGDTLVLDSMSFVDSTWLGRGGLFHSENMRIVEKLTRKGNEIRYDMTIEDPDVFVEPWVMPTRILRRGGPAMAIHSRARQLRGLRTGQVTNQLRH